MPGPTLERATVTERDAPEQTPPRRRWRFDQGMRSFIPSHWPIRVSLAVVLIAASLFTNRSFLGWGLFVIFAVMLVPLGRLRSFFLSFVPYAGIWFIFTALRSLADETMLARTLNTQVAAFERWLFGGQLPSVWLQDRLFDMGQLHWWDYACTAVHWSYFFVPHAVAIRLWYKHPALFRQFLGAMTLFLAVGLCVYFLIPSNPPWLAPEQINSPSAPIVHRVMETIGRELGGGVYTATYAVVGESNPIAAMPSIHMAFTFLLVFPAYRAGRNWFIVALLYAASMGFSLVYLGEHYVVDIVIGSLITWYAWVAAGVWMRSVAPAIKRPGIGEPAEGYASPTPSAAD